MRPGKAGNSKLPASFSMSCSPRFCSKATSGTCLAARICSRVQRGDGLGEQGGVIVFPPMRLNQDVIDLLEIDDAGLVAHASMRELKHRLRVRRKSPSPERTINERASA